MNFVNLTDHNIFLPGGKILPPSGTIARCAINHHTVAIIDGMELTREVLSNVSGLPPEQEGTMYIVSSYVRRAANWRMDLASPGRPRRDREKNIIGCENLVIN